MYMDDILNIAKELSEIYEISYNIIKLEVLFIIENNITDIKIIENCLDRLLDIPTDKGFMLLNKLCDYYSNIDKEGAKFYLDSYREMYGEEDKKLIKKKKN